MAEVERDNRDELALLLLLYLWDDDVLRYVNARTGRRISDRAIKQAMNTLAVRARRELRTLTRQATTGELPVPEWQRQFSEFVKSLVLMMYAVALGGWAQLTQADKRQASAMLRYHVGKFAKFALAFAAGRLSADAAMARAELYGSASAGVLEEARRFAWEKKAAPGVVHEARNILGDADHCEENEEKHPGIPGCPQETARGWVLLSEMSSPGKRICKTNCKCRLSIRTRKS